MGVILRVPTVNFQMSNEKMEQPRPWKVDSNQRVFKKMHKIKKS